MSGANRLANQMKLHGSMAVPYSNPIVGFVSSYDPDRYCCKITIQEADESGEGQVVSGWIPVATIWSGNEWGVFCPPSVGDMVEVDFQEGDFEAGHCDWRFFNNDNRPVHAESGVFYVVHKSGSALKFNNDGSVDLITDTDLRATVGGNLAATVGGTTSVESVGNATVKAPQVIADAPLTACTGNLSVAGGITCTGTYGGSGGNITTPGNITSTNGDIADKVRTLQADRVLERTHTHTDPQGGSTSAQVGGM